MGGRPPTIAKALAGLERDGLLMQSDARLPSVVTLVVGKPVRGSWWGHPKGDAIHILNTQLRAHPDVIALCFVFQKITYIHRRVWPELFGVAAPPGQWQTQGLSRRAHLVRRRVEKEGLVRSDDPAWVSAQTACERRAVVRELEERMLVHCIEIHTERGSHSKALQSWARCRKQKQFRGRPLPAHVARERFEELVRRLWTGANVEASLPWQRRLVQASHRL